MCQCPKRAFLISTGGVKWWLISLDLVCQCPKRAFLISTPSTRSRTLLRQCVNALNGLFSFLPATTTIDTRPLQNTCQCPRRAILISTVPSGSPHKYWLSSPIFAGICQTILKTAVFLQFFGLFIICSYFTVPLAPSMFPLYVKHLGMKTLFHTSKNVM